MQYLGEFLSPNNSISQDQDKLTKYFYFRPDRYDNPEADIENIFKIKDMPEFPKRLDKLSENQAYAIESIEVSKRISDEETGVKKVSYIVTATYDLLENIKKREHSGGGGTSEKQDTSVTIYVDEDGNKIVGQIPPWKQRASWNFQPIELTVPFLKAYIANSDYWNKPSIDVVNSAGNVIMTETKKFQLEITYQKNYKEPQEWEWIIEPFVNSKAFNLDFDYRGYFEPKTLLLLPPTYSTQWAEIDRLDAEGNPERDDEGNLIKDIVRYYSYSVRMIYDPEGHDKKLLDIGTYAKFGSDPKPSQIWELSIADANTGMLIGEPKFVSASEVLKEQASAVKNNRIVNASPVTEPVPLTSAGTIDALALTDPVNYPIRTLKFTKYSGMDFNELPFKN
jgi:hypothetical protein